MRNQLAPEWKLDKWIHLPPGKKTLRRADFAGRVLYLYCYQSWCPACHSHGFPLLQKLVRHYSKTDDVEFVAVQTVFEGFGTNTEARGKATAKRYGLAIPFAHDAGADGKGSELLRTYQTGGTPWTILVDRDGVVRFDGFSSRLTLETATKMIDELRAEKPIVGRPFGESSIDFAKHELTLVRCCSTSSPGGTDTIAALAELCGGDQDAGLAMLALVQPHDKSVHRLLGQLGIPTAADPARRKLREFVHDNDLALAEPTFVVDRHGKIVWFHPGPNLFGADRRKDPRANRDWNELQRIIRRRLGSSQRPARSRPAKK